MLSPDHRLRQRAAFTAAVRRGRRAGGRTVTVHLLAAAAPPDRPPRAGLVVSKAVGGSVVRSRVARRLRHQLRPLLGRLPAGADLVVRAHPAAAAASSAELGADLASALTRVLRPDRPGPGR